MSESESQRSLRERQVDALIAEYYQSVERGEPFDQSAFLAAHPDFADELREFLGDVGQLGDLVRPAVPDLGETRIQPPSEAPDFVPGTVIRYFGEYELLEQVGMGGMGIVYKARQSKLKRVVALKLIKSGTLANPHDLQRFQVEARAAARLSHPGIVPVHEVGVFQDQHFYTMEYVAGGSLSRLYRDGPVAARHAAELVQQLAKAMHYAHQHGIVHRDLKPANVLLTDDGQPRITDFGLAKLTESEGETHEATLTETGQILGTAGYMSPEQAAGKTQLVGPPTDIYALGAVLYALLTSRAPFVGETLPHTLMQVLHKEPVSPLLLNPSLPRDLETICLKCLEKEPHKRYGTAELLAEDLGRFLDGRPVIARPIGPLARGWRWGRRNPVVAGLLATVAASLLIGTAVSTYYWDQSKTRLGELRTANDKLGKQFNEISTLTSAQAVSLEVANQQVYHLRMSQMGQLWREKNWGSLDRLQSESVPALGDKDLRGWEWHYLHAQVAQRVWNLPEGPSVRTAFDWDRTTGELAVLVPGKVEIWLPHERRLLKSIEVPDIDCYYIASWSPDHHHIAVGASNLNVHVIDTRTGRVVCTVTEPQPLPADKHEGYLTNVDWSPLGDCIAVTRAHTKIRLWKLAPEPVMLKWLEADRDGGPQRIHWSTDAALCITTSVWGEMLFWNTADWTLLRRQKVVEGFCSDSVFSPNGKRVAFASRQVVIANSDGTQIKSLRDQGTGIENLCWLDNERLVTANGAQELRIVAVDQSVPDQVSRLHSSKTYGLRVGPDAQIASAAIGEPVKVWSLHEVESDHIVLSGAMLPHTAPACVWHPSENVLAMISSEQGINYAATWAPGSLQATHIPMAEDAKGVLWNPGGDALMIEQSGGKWRTIPWPTTISEKPSVDSVKQMGPMHACSNDQRFRLEVGTTVEEVSIVDMQGKTAMIYPDIGGFFASAWHPSETRIAIADYGRIHMFDPQCDPMGRVTSGYSEMLHTVSCLAWSRDGQYLLGGSYTGAVHVFDGATLKELHVLRGHTGTITAVTWSHNDTRIISAGVDGFLRWWDADRGIELLKMPIDSTDGIIELCSSADEKWLAGRCASGKVHVWTTEQSEPASQVNRVPVQKQLSLSERQLAPKFSGLTSGEYQGDFVVATSRGLRPSELTMSVRDGTVLYGGKFIPPGNQRWLARHNQSKEMYEQEQAIQAAAGLMLECHATVTLNGEEIHAADWVSK